jgi:hypothetical protein
VSQSSISNAQKHVLQCVDKRKTHAQLGTVQLVLEQVLDYLVRVVTQAVHVQGLGVLVPQFTGVTVLQFSSTAVPTSTAQWQVANWCSVRLFTHKAREALKRSKQTKSTAHYMSTSKQASATERHRPDRSSIHIWSTFGSICCCWMYEYVLQYVA